MSLLNWHTASCVVLERYLERKDQVGNDLEQRRPAVARQPMWVDWGHRVGRSENKILQVETKMRFEKNLVWERKYEFERQFLLRSNNPALPCDHVPWISIESTHSRVSAQIKEKGRNKAESGRCWGWVTCRNLPCPNSTLNALTFPEAANRSLSS